MRIVFFPHSVVSDWNHGNAHFLRGLMRALGRRGHDVLACERRGSWSSGQLFEERGAEPFVTFARLFPDLQVRFYAGDNHIIDEVDELTRAADLVILHEFAEPELAGALSHNRRRRGDFVLLFHDTHHRTVSSPHEIARYNLEHCDGVLAYGNALAEVYRREFGRQRVWTFHEAADTSIFRPLEREKIQDVIWIGNWGDDERTGDVLQYVVAPARQLPQLRFAAHGVRYPPEGIQVMATAGIEFRGWIPNYEVPEAFASSRMTLHIPRGPYVRRLRGIPTIRPFEALACGIPLLSTPWEDDEGLFRAEQDYVLVRSPSEMRDEMVRLAGDEDARERLAESGLETILARHTCERRAEQLEGIFEEVAAVF